MKLRNLIVAGIMTFGIGATVLPAVSSPVYATNPAKSAQEGLKGADPQGGAGPNINTWITRILNGVYAVIGIVAVIMIIIGGVSYATSQGDSSKVEKGKKTIMYGIIGLVIVLIAFALTNFILSVLVG